MSERSKHRMTGDFDLEAAGYAGVRKLTTQSASELAEMDIHVRTLQALAAPHAAISQLIASGQTSDDTDAMIAALWTGIVVQYCRCFEGSQRHSLDADLVFDDSVEWRREHSKLVDIRSKHVAHDLNNLRFADVGVEVDAGGGLGRLVRPFAQFSPAPTDLVALAVLIGRARAYAEVARRALIRTVVKEARTMTGVARLELPALRYEGLDKTPLKTVRRSGKSAARRSSSSQ